MSFEKTVEAKLEEFGALKADAGEAMRALREYAKTEGEKIVGAAFKQLLDTFPEVDRVSWMQYTPHFNDGDACVFHVHSLQVIPVSADDEDGEYDGAFELWRDGPEGISAEARKAFKELWEKINDDELMLATFGDHVKVRIDREGVEVDDYDHD